MSPFRRYAGDLESALAKCAGATRPLCPRWKKIVAARSYPPSEGRRQVPSRRRVQSVTFYRRNLRRSAELG